MTSSTALSLRQVLRDATQESHSRLDSSVSRFDLTSRAGYARFLCWQLEARMPVEDWLARYAGPQLMPPDTAPGLVADLAELRFATFVPNIHFVAPISADPIGVVWAIAGSHLGNRAVLMRMRKAGARFPARFLGDERMLQFWKQLLPSLEIEVAPERAEAAAQAACALFDHFIATLDSGDRKLAA